MALPPEVISAIHDIVHELSVGNFVALERDGRAGRLTAQELREAVGGYGGVLTDVPVEALERANAYEIEDAGNEWFVNVDLWTTDEQPSDLTLSLEAKRLEDGKVEVSIDDLHVL
jgi:hypothetical protein